MASRQPATRARGMVSLAEAATLAGVSTRTLRRRIAEGILPAYRSGPRLIRVNPADLMELIKPMNSTAAADWNRTPPSARSPVSQHYGLRYPCLGPLDPRDHRTQQAPPVRTSPSPPWRVGRNWPRRSRWFYCGRPAPCSGSSVTARDCACAQEAVGTTCPPYAD